LIEFTVQSRCSTTAARTGVLQTPHGAIETPAFMPVGTYGSVKGLRAEELEGIGAQVVLSNAYHLWERPGLDVMRAVGGLHAFMGWERPILTDSGGYQVMSLADRRSIDDDGVTFRSPLDGEHRRLTPEAVIDIQATLGVDLAMVLDECVASPAEYKVAAAAVERSHRWAERSRPLASQLAGGLLGIVQGSVFPELRGDHARRLVELDFDGYAIGGLAVGEAKEQTWEAVEAAIPELPEDRVRYVMGMGYPNDLVEAVARGVDLFDCVIPTRHARNGVAFTRTGTIIIRHARYKDDPEPLDPACGCPTCARYCRAYLRHLKLRGEMLAGVLMTLHNLWHYLDTMGRIRHAIASGAFAELRADSARAGAPSGQE
jgi:queuine tRNA-ribosyltransferase